MEPVFSWMERYIAVFLLFAMMSYLIPRDTYRRYIMFFMRLVFVLLLVTPVFSVFFQERMEKGEDFYRSFVQEMEEREREAEEMSFLDEGYLEFVRERLEEEEE